MFEDILVIIWKEWKEVILTGSSARGGLLGVVVIVGLLGIVMPLQVWGGLADQPGPAPCLVMAACFPGGWNCGRCLCRRA